MAYMCSLKVMYFVRFLSHRVKMIVFMYLCVWCIGMSVNTNGTIVSSVCYSTSSSSVVVEVCLSPDGWSDLLISPLHCLILLYAVFCSKLCFFILDI
jgi:hypothetical protein